MRFLTTTVLILLAAFCLSGCGGGGGNSGGGGGNGGGGGGIGTADKYAGTYIGSYENGTTGAIGQFSFAVGSDGTLSNGTIVISGSTVALTGSISSTGAATFNPAGQNSASGTMSAAGATTISSTLTDTKGNTIWVVALFNPTGPVAGGNSFSNDYTGPFKNNTKGDTGIDAFYVDGSGNITGIGLIDVSGTIEFATVGGSISGTGALTYTFKVNGNLITTITGNVALTNSTLAGSLTNTAGDSLSLEVQAVN